MKMTLVLLAALAISGCATCDRHPVACGVGMAVAAGTMAAVMVAHNHQKAFVTPPPSNTGGNLL